ncbi:hypothetical protein H6G93_18935 [Nostoc sp. FACHB-973]|uniref:Uncharacterized protein n=4 Tax=Nostocales TaxID=1161 RepID=A0A8J6ZI99_DESMC|nr:hypothetical protein [Desmonostoc muscorum FACHB-395]MBD2517054.1 hypothetical protein [Nostoc sp. FACHB-973]MBD2564128.1 hypothetical protein [Nostoc linckia FACHB-391]MBD2649795.1 hypothetical protein [Nostoc foliaceum FACHB-393]
MHKKEFHPDGSLKNEARQEMLSVGMSNEAIDDYASRLKARYDEWKHLDEIDPEPWPIYTAYDFFTEQEKKEFNPDGSLRPEYVEYAQKIGISESALEQLEWRKKIEVENYDAVSADYAEQGINFGEQKMNARIGASRTYVQRRQQMEQDLRNFEPEDSLPFDKDTVY